jgi:acetoin utilization protein AcuC
MPGDVALVYSEELNDYDLGRNHPLKPARVTNSVGLMRAYGLLGEGGASVVEPDDVADEDLLRVHAPEYLEAVQAASRDPHGFRPAMGIGTGDNPASPGMYEVSRLICGGAIRGLDDVIEGRFARTFNIAGGLHHAHRSRAAGFCVLNDPAVAIARALDRRPSLKVTYIDIDAHHGDGVEEAFWEESRVLTVSLHQSGRTLFPGTGRTDDIGAGDGLGYAANLPMPPLSTDDCYVLAVDDFVAPLVSSFSPDVIVLQAGADAHHADPLTVLGMTLGGYLRLTGSIRDLAEDICDGRLAACGGGGYAFSTVVPLAWTILMANLLDTRLPEEIPDSWTPDSRGAPDLRRPTKLTRDDEFRITTMDAHRLYDSVRETIDAARRALGPYHDLG